MELFIRAEPFELSEDAARFVHAHNAAHEAVRARRDRHEAERQRLDALNPLAWSPADVKSRRKLKEQEIEIIQAELPLLKALEQWEPIRQRERRMALDRAQDLHQDATQPIREALAKIGFDSAKYVAALLDITPDERHRTQGMADGILETLVYFHPSMARTQNQVMKLIALADAVHDLRPQDIKAAIDKAEAKLRELIAAL